MSENDGFVWTDEARPSPTAQPRERMPKVARLSPLDAWEPVRRRGWRARILGLARAALGGRRALLLACVELSEAFNTELRQALRA